MARIVDNRSVTAHQLIFIAGVQTTAHHLHFISLQIKLVLNRIILHI